MCNLEFVIYLDSTIELNGCLHEGILMNEVKLSQIKYLKVFLWYFVYLTEHFMHPLNETKRKCNFSIREVPL